MSCLSFMLAVSMHIGLTGDYNNIHPHARCQQDAIISGLYYNSEDKVSAYIGTTHNEWELGLVTGYTYSDVVPMIRYKKNNFFITPAYERNGTLGIVMGLEV